MLDATHRILCDSPRTVNLRLPIPRPARCALSQNFLRAYPSSRHKSDKRSTRRRYSVDTEFRAFFYGGLANFIDHWGAPQPTPGAPVRPKEINHARTLAAVCT